jgi:ribosomal protein S25
MNKKSRIALALRALLEEEASLKTKIAALRLAEQILASTVPREVPEKPQEPRRTQQGRKIDRDSLAKTAAFVAHSRKTVTTSMIARHFHISLGAAGQRLQKAEKKGLIRRLRPGKYGPGRHGVV